MSPRARWIAGLVAVVAIGLVASIPAFLDHSGVDESQVARYAWLDQVPVSRDIALPDPSTPIGAAPDGQRLLATRIPDGAVCMHFGDSGRQCVSVDTDRQIQLVARARGPEQNVLWGVLADDVVAIGVRRADGSVFSRDVRRAFGVLEVLGRPRPRPSAGKGLWRRLHPGQLRAHELCHDRRELLRPRPSVSRRP